MERFFRNLKNEWVPVTGYISFSEAAHAITGYIVGYYSELRPHEYNGGNLVALQQILGHANINQTMAYAHLSPDYLQLAVLFNPLKGDISI